MGLRFVYDPKQDDVPSLEILRRMKDLFVTDIRTSLLSGVFKENADDLEVTGAVEAGSVVIVIRDHQKARELAKKVPGRSFSRVQGEQDAGPSEVSDASRAQGGVDLPGPGDIVDDRPFSPRASLFAEQTEDEFRGVRRIDEVTPQVADRIKMAAKDFVSQYVKAKQETIKA